MALKLKALTVALSAVVLVLLAGCRPQPPSEFELNHPAAPPAGRFGRRSSR